jgi:predicted  nucleic acid-binding Zn-ribbon protein
LKSSASISLSEAKNIASLKAKIKELELQNVTLEADRSSLNETIASQLKTISSQQSQIKQLEESIDKLKVAFQQNASNVSIWKQQLQSYQEVNEQLSRKMTEMAELYEKFGDILKRD